MPRLVPPVWPRLATGREVARTGRRDRRRLRSALQGLAYLASREVRATLGHDPALARAAQAVIPGAKFVEFPTLGHAPHMQGPDAFGKALLAGLGAR